MPDNEEKNHDCLNSVNQDSEPCKYSFAIENDIFIVFLLHILNTYGKVQGEKTVAKVHTDEDEKFIVVPCADTVIQP